jgi:hypothetical protein
MNLSHNQLSIFRCHRVNSLGKYIALHDYFSCIQCTDISHSLFSINKIFQILLITLFSLFSSTTNASVSFGSWQHVCFTIDTRKNLWSFYKDGLLTDIALSSVPKFSADALDTADNKVFIGRNPMEASIDHIVVGVVGCRYFGLNRMQTSVVENDISEFKLRVQT